MLETQNPSRLQSRACLVNHNAISQREAGIGCQPKVEPQQTWHPRDKRRARKATSERWTQSQLTKSVAYVEQLREQLGACGWFLFSSLRKGRERTNHIEGINDNLGTKWIPDGWRNNRYRVTELLKIGRDIRESNVILFFFFMTWETRKESHIIIQWLSQGKDHD